MADDCVDLRTSYLGLALDNPLVASPAPPNAQLHYLRQLEDAGIGAVVLPSLFEEQLLENIYQMEALDAATQATSAEAPASYFPESALAGPYGVGPEAYLHLIEQAKKALAVPVIASLNGATAGGWEGYAAAIQEAGADALELNIYHVPVDISESGAEVEERYLKIVQGVRSKIQIPLVVKLPPYFSAIGHMAGRLVDAGANGLVIFNRFLQPDINLAKMDLSSELELSQPGEMRLSLLWIAVLAGRLKCSLAGSIGVENSDQLVKYLLAGSDVVMTTSALLRHGPGHVATLLAGLREWCEQREVTDLSRIRGIMSRERLKDNLKGVYQRANYLHLIRQYSARH